MDLNNKKKWMKIRRISWNDNVLTLTQINSVATAKTLSKICAHLITTKTLIEGVIDIFSWAFSQKKPIIIIY